MIRFHMKTIYIWKVNCGKIYSSARTYSNKYSSAVIRQTFLDYFLIKNDHKFIRSSPVIPFCDPTVAFVNAGMNQFKAIFLGKQEPMYTKVANSQKCVRVGGKHNDLNMVGVDGYHHTFFEMLGNWSFGDYFKREACEMAWDLLTRSYGLNPSAFYITYFGGDSKLNLEPDLECKDIWRSLGISDDHIIPFGLNENFWEMGPVGPCGPCTEIHIDTSGRSNRSRDVNKGFPDLIELWNIVFIQYNRNKDGSINLLPKHHIDTGIGFERLTAVLQNKKSNYDTDIFKYLFDTTKKNSKEVSAYGGKFGSKDMKGIDTSYRILADHSRMIVACLADGMIPEENQKLRRVIRKAFSISETIFGKEKGLLNELSYAISEYLGEVYPEMRKNILQVQQIIKYEEEVYKTIRSSATKDWQRIINKEPKLRDFNVIEMPGLIAACNELISSSNIESISPQLAFKLYDTYGIDEHTIKQLAYTLNMVYDPEILKNELENARNRTKLGYQSNNNLEQIANELSTQGIEKTQDYFKYSYVKNNDEYTFDEVDVNILRIVENNRIVNSINDNTNCYLILNQSNLYTEEGGQMSDTGFIQFPNALFHVENVKNVNGYIFHEGKFMTQGVLKVGTQGVLFVNKENRLKLMSNHTATHLLNAALKKQAGIVCQKSSKVMPDSLMFSIGVYSGKFSTDDIEKVENIVKQVINEAVDVKIREINSQELLKLDDLTLIPGEFYPDEGIRLVEIKSDNLYSCEPCCGTHVLNTKDIGDISLVGFRSLGRSTTSLLAVTGDRATESRNYGDKIMQEVLNFRTIVNNASEEVEALNKMLVDLRRKLSTKNEDILLPVHIRGNCTKILNDLSRQLRDIERHSLKQFVDMEMKSVLETNSMRSSSNRPYIVHFLGCSSILDNIPLQRATKLCTNVPCIILSYTDDFVKARCCVPDNLINDNFNAEIWLTRTVATVFKTGAQFVKGQNNDTVCNMKPKRINKIEWDQLLEEALKSARNYADTYL